MFVARRVHSVIGRRLLSSSPAGVLGFTDSRDTGRIHVCTQDATAIITLTSPKTRNALGSEMVKELHNAFDSIESSGARCLILAHQGPAFSSGHDLREIHAMQAANDQKSVAGLFAQTSSLVQRIPAMSIPVIAAVNGVAAAAGCQLALSADLVVATESSSFVTPGARVGLFCTTPGVAVAGSAPPKIAAEMLLCGHGIPANRAAQVGMINFSVPNHADDTPKTIAGVPAGAESAALSKALSLATTIAQYDAQVIARGKLAMQQVACTSGLDNKYAIAGKVMANAVGNDACQEGISAFLDKREPVWPSSG